MVNFQLWYSGGSGLRGSLVFSSSHKVIGYLLHVYQGAFLESVSPGLLLDEWSPVPQVSVDLWSPEDPLVCEAWVSVHGLGDEQSDGLLPPFGQGVEIVGLNHSPVGVLPSIALHCLRLGFGHHGVEHNGVHLYDRADECSVQTEEAVPLNFD